MAFFNFRTRGAPANERRSASVAAAPAESVEALRRRARHRLLGAAVLVLIGVIGFPLLFDSQPRPIAVDIPIEIPDRNRARPLVVPATPNPATAAAGREPSAAPVASPDTGMITERADGTEVAADRPPVTAAAQPRPPAERRPEVRPETARPVPPARPPASAAVAAKPAASEDAGRFVVQVGAFADGAKAQEVRQKLERAGIKTYTHVAKTADGERTRVRVGPFTSRAEADRAAGRVKGLSLPAAILTL